MNSNELYRDGNAGNDVLGCRGRRRVLSADYNIFNFNPQKINVKRQFTFSFAERYRFSQRYTNFLYYY